MIKEDVADEAKSSRGRRRLTAGELATWRSLIDTTAELRRVLGAQLQESGLSPADYQVLLALSEADGRRLRSSELAASIDWERSRLSHHLGRMERRGLDPPRRLRHRQPRCRGLAHGRGSGLFRRATAPHMRAIKKHFADALTPEQFDALAGILQTLRRHLNRRRHRRASS